MRLSAEQLSFFKQQGYLILPQILDPDLCEHARDLLWESLPENADIIRHQPSTHGGPFSAKDHQDDPVNSRVGYRWQLRQHSTDTELLDLLYSETVMAVAAQLLGEGAVQQPVAGGSVMGSEGKAWPDGPVDPALSSQGIRGIYATLPYGESKDQTTSGAHTDGHPFMLSVVGLIDDCPPGGGAFTVWPGSHQRLYPLFPLQYDQLRIPFYEHMPSLKGIVQPPEYDATLAEILSDTQPVDCWGRAGDIVLWHHRLVHAASENYSNTIRQAVLADLNRCDLDSLRLNPPYEDMWHDWSPELQAADSVISDEFYAQQRCARFAGDTSHE